MSIHDVRKLGREYCQTDGSQHYRENGINPIEYAIANGMIEDFCLINIIKYASRFKHTRKLDDLKKVSDYAHILAGVELSKSKDRVCGDCETVALKSCDSCNNWLNDCCQLMDAHRKLCKASGYCFWEKDEPEQTSESDKSLLRGCFTCGNRDNRFMDGCSLSCGEAIECRAENLKHYVSDDALLDISGSEVTD